MIDGPQLISALSALGEQLDYMGGTPINLIICGGSALQILGLVSRTTKDVDVLALGRTGAASSLELLSADSLPDDLLSAANIVARDLGLEPNWLNNKAALAKQRLPEGLCERLHSKRYGDRLTIHAIDRFDQICLKLHAVVDRDSSSHHLQDLLALRPSDEEMTKAKDWCLSQDAGEDFPSLLRSCLKQIGYLNVGRSIEG